MQDEPKTFSVPNTYAERICITMHDVISAGFSNVWQLSLTDLRSNWKYFGVHL